MATVKVVATFETEEESAISFITAKGWQAEVPTGETNEDGSPVLGPNPETYVVAIENWAKGILTEQIAQHRINGLLAELNAAREAGVAQINEAVGQALTVEGEIV